MANSIIHGASFHHVALKVNDFDASLAFYKALGFEVFKYWGEGDSRAAMLDIGSGEYFEVFAGGSNETPFQFGSVPAKVAQLVLQDILYQEYMHRNPKACEENLQQIAAALSEKHV